jgi:hypothetical protein
MITTKKMKEPTKTIKVKFITPPNQAKKTIDSNKLQVLGFRLSKKVVNQKVTAHNKFFWVIECTEKEARNIDLKCYGAQKKIKEVPK